MQKIKQFIESDRGKDIFVVIIVLLVGLSSFGLGRLSKNTTNQGVSVEYLNQDQMNQNQGNVLSAFTEETNTNTIKSGTQVNSNKLPSVSNSVGKSFFASNRGQKYYSIGCSAGKTIKQENRVYFATKAEAEKAGYELSSSCR